MTPRPHAHRPHRPHGPARGRRAPAAAAVAPVVGVLALAACGVSPEPKANEIPADDVPFGLLDDEPTTTIAAAGRTASVFLVTEDRLVAVERTIAEDADLGDILEQVTSGPSEVEQSLGITTAVPGGTIKAVDVERGVAEVDLAASFGDIRSRDQLLALGQIVYTLTEQPGVGGVRFTLEGKPVSVPLADGTLSEDALSRDDFEALAPA